MCVGGVGGGGEGRCVCWGGGGEVGGRERVEIGGQEGNYGRSEPQFDHDLHFQGVGCVGVCVCGGGGGGAREGLRRRRRVVGWGVGVVGRTDQSSQ